MAKDTTLTDDSLEQAVTLYGQLAEQGQHTGDAAAETLERNPDVRHAMQDLLDMRTVGQHIGVDSDEVAQRLAAFHQQHLATGDATEMPDTGRHARVRWLPWAGAAAVVAAVVLVFVFFPKLADHSMTYDTDAMAVAAAHSGSLSIVDERGQVLATNKTKKRHAVISINDYRQTLRADNADDRVALSVPLGKSADVTLPDGSVIALHPGANVIFPKTFADDRRVIMLEGEAYLKVKHDEARPFIVLTKDATTTVLGTEFDVNTLSGSTVVTLIRGKVRVDDAARTNSIIINPGMQASVGEQRIATTQVDVKPYQYWAEGLYYYDDVPLSEVINELARNYNLQVEYRDQAARQLHVRFMASRTGDLTEALDMLRMLHKVSLDLDGRRLIVGSLE